MTFEEFSAAGKWFEDIRKVTDDDYESRGGFGYPVAGGEYRLAIEKVSEDRYSLMLDRTLTEHEDVHVLEFMLYKWALTAGYFDKDA